MSSTETDRPEVQHEVEVVQEGFDQRLIEFSWAADFLKQEVPAYVEIQSYEQLANQFVAKFVRGQLIQRMGESGQPTISELRTEDLADRFAKWFAPLIELIVKQNYRPKGATVLQLTHADVPKTQQIALGLVAESGVHPPIDARINTVLSDFSWMKKDRVESTIAVLIREYSINNIGQLERVLHDLFINRSKGTPSKPVLGGEDFMIKLSSELLKDLYSLPFIFTKAYASRILAS